MLFNTRYFLAVLMCITTLNITANTTVFAEQQKLTEGTVVETMDASDYTYMYIETDSEKIWVAIPATEVAVGDEVTFTRGMVMNNFHSTALDRTFASIIFSPGLESEQDKDSSTEMLPSQKGSSSFAEALEKEVQQPASVQPQTSVSAGSAGATVPFVDVKIEKATGANGYTVAEIFAQAETLNNNKVRVRGKVVKVSPNIMGRNWIHIQDGTGDPLHNTHDLVVTSQEPATVDEIALFEGILTAKKDFGFGYKYDVIIEQATLAE